MKKETARLRHQYANFEVIQEHKISKNSTANGSIPNVATVTNQAIKMSQPAAATNNASTDSAAPVASDKDELPIGSRKSYLELKAEDIENLETHARRVGYTISTV